MRRVHLFAVSMALVALTGCGERTTLQALGGSEDRAVEAGDDDDEGSPIEETPTVSLRCVSEVLGEDLDNVLLRLAISGSANGGTVTVEHGQQFRSHGGVPSVPWAAVPAPASHRFVVDNETLIVADGDDAAGFTVTLATPDALGIVRATWSGERELALVCWNDTALFGSAWTGSQGSLPARFDWRSGACLDETGAPARNPLPIEIVRETGVGECVDIAVPLNDDDFGYPDLSGWNLLGADLTQAGLFFANLHAAMLQGARFDSLAFGYAEITGVIDDSSVVPEGCVVDVDDDTISCRQ